MRRQLSAEDGLSRTDARNAELRTLILAGTEGDVRKAALLWERLSVYPSPPQTAQEVRRERR